MTFLGIYFVLAFWICLIALIVDCTKEEAVAWALLWPFILIGIAIMNAWKIVFESLD